MHLLKPISLTVVITSVVSWLLLRWFTVVVTSNLMVLADGVTDEQFAEMHQGVAFQNQRTAEIVLGTFQQFSTPLVVIGGIFLLVFVISFFLDRSRR